MSATVTALFAGCGGLDLGLIRAGGSVVKAYDFDADACAAYPAVTSHDVIEQADLTRFDLGKLPDTDGIIGGPPCQDFSTGGTGNGKDGARNMWPVAVSAIKEKRPSWFLFENVVGLIQRHKDYFDLLTLALSNLGYKVDWRILDAADYGVPQNRQRIFVVGRRDGRDWNWPRPTHAAKGDGKSISKWVSIQQTLQGWIEQGHEQTDLPRWITAHYPRTLWGDGLPDAGYFAGQNASASGCHHRDLSQPAFTVLASDHCRNRLKVGEKIWRVDEAALALLQTLPPTVTNRRVIGNAVPPLLSQRIFEAALS